MVPGTSTINKQKTSPIDKPFLLIGFTPAVFPSSAWKRFVGHVQVNFVMHGDDSCRCARSGAVALASRERLCRKTQKTGQPECPGCRH
jgi:hypothetical protein